METSYIYSSSRVKVVEKELISGADVDKLLSVPRGDNLMQALKETYLSSFISGNEIKDVLKGLEEHVFGVKKLLIEISPVPKSFDFLWVKYDFQNLKVLLRMKKGNFSNEVIPYLSKLGKYTPEYLLDCVLINKMDRLELEFKVTYEKALKVLEEQGIASADQVMDKGYFSLAKRLADETKNKAIKQIVRLQIDLYNLKTRFRTLQVPRTSDDSWFVEGGSFNFSEIKEKEQALAKLYTFGGDKFWREAVAEYLAEGHSTLLDVGADNYLLSAVREIDRDVFSMATLLTYFIKSQNSALTIQAIITGKESGQSEEIIRKRLRNIYV